MAFIINEYKFGVYRGLMIVDPDKKHHIDILPGCGALIARLELFGLELVEPLESHGQLQGEHRFRNFWLMPFQNRIRDGHYAYQGKSYEVPVNEKERNNALHGFFNELALKDIKWEVSDKKAEVRIWLDYHGKQAGYPFPFSVNIHYELSTDGKVDLHYHVENTGGGAMPFSFGWHPYFQLDGDRSTWQLQCGPLLHHELDERNLPTGVKRPFPGFDLATEAYDHSFQYETAPYQISMSSSLYELTINQDENLGYVQVFTHPLSNSVAIEPISSGVDAFNTGEGLIEIAPGEPLEGTISLQLHQKTQ